MSTPFSPEPKPERDNGLVAAAYRRLRTVDRRETDAVLEAMRKAEIACYLAAPADGRPSTRDIFVDASKQAYALEVAETALRVFASRRVAIDADEVDARFAELIGSLGTPAAAADPTESPEPPPTEAPEPPPASPAPPPPPATPPASPQMWREPSSDWLTDESDDEGYEPPPPGPLPRPTRRVAAGILLLIVGSVALFAPSSLPLPGTVSLVLGVGLLAAGAAWLVMQLRENPEDPYDDGARV